MKDFDSAISPEARAATIVGGWARASGPVTLSVAAKGRAARVEVPAAALRILAAAMTAMARGARCAVTAVDAELTTQQAAELLSVSRPFVIRLIEERRLPARKVGRHRRVRAADVLALKRRMDADRRRALGRLTREARRLGLGY